MKIRIHTEPLPKSDDAVISLFKKALRLSAVMEIAVTPTEFRVSRTMDDDDSEPVFPKQITNITADLEFLLSKLDEMATLVNGVFLPTENPYAVLRSVTKQITDQRLGVVAIMAPSGFLFADYFGLEEGSKPEAFMGIRVIYHDLPHYPDKLVVLGGPNTFVNDATYGVIVDPGV
jgi:hypothetical protein